MSDHDDGLYWIRRMPGAAAEVARCDAGRWHVLGRSEPVEARQLYQIGRPAEPPAGALEALAEKLDQGGLLGV